MPWPGGVPLDNQQWPGVCWQVLGLHELSRLSQRQQRRSAGCCVSVCELSISPRGWHGIQEQGHLLVAPCQLPQVLGLCWACESPLCCEGHAKPTAEVGLPWHALGLQQPVNYLAWRAVSCAGMSTRAIRPCRKVLTEIALLGNRCAAPADTFAPFITCLTDRYCYASGKVYACLDGLHRLPCACLLQRKGLPTRQRQAFPASAGGPSPHGSPRRHPWGVALLEGWSLGRAWCRGTSTLKAFGLSLSLPLRRAAGTPDALPVWNPAPSGGRAS